MSTTVDAPRAGWVADDSSFGARLALIRQRMQWGNVKEAADACQLPAESWRRWERDGRLPRNVVQIATTIAARTGCDFGWLLDPRLRGSTEGYPPRPVRGIPRIPAQREAPTSRPPRGPNSPAPATRPASPNRPVIYQRAS